VESECRLARDIPKSGGLGRFTFVASLHAKEGALPVPRGSRACLASKDARANARRARPQGGNGKREVLEDGMGGNALLPPRKARVGRSRSRSRVVRNVAKVDGWLFDAEKRGFSTSTDLETFGDGRLALGLACESTGRPSAKGTRAGSKRKLT